MPAPAFEQVINKPLSGEDVRRIIMVKIGDMLTRDSRLAGYMAFPSFSAVINLAINLEGAVHQNIEREVRVSAIKEGHTVAPDAPSTVVVDTDVIAAAPPNEMRVEAGLGVPVLTRDEKGREIEKEVKYAKKVERRSKAGA